MEILHLNWYGAEHTHHWPPLLTFFLVFMIIFILIGIWRRRYMACRSPRWFHYHDFYRSDASEILKKRYAQGEINKEEYERMKREINNQYKI